MFLLYTSELNQVLQKHGINGHGYADDNKIYLSVPVSESVSAAARVSLALEDIHDWMDSNRLKLNADKTQFMWFGSGPNLKKINVCSISVGSTSVQTCQKVKDLAVMLDGTND